jgi:AraC family transcriptional regulator
MMAGRQRVRNYGERLKEVEDYIGEHMDQPLDRAVLAEIAGFSVPHFHRIFTAHTGENIAGHVRRVRLERAARKLRMGAVDITEVALAAGYDTHAAFAKAFRRQFGLTPSEFRQLSCNAATELLMNTEKLK